VFKYLEGKGQLNGINKSFSVLDLLRIHDSNVHACKIIFCSTLFGDFWWQVTLRELELPEGASMNALQLFQHEYLTISNEPKLRPDWHPEIFSSQVRVAVQRSRLVVIVA
jgi:hypothetical protein